MAIGRTGTEADPLRPGEAALRGVAAVLAGLGLGELVAGLLPPHASPTASVAGFAVDIAPAWAKELAISWFGVWDKVAIIVGIVVVLLVLAVLAGLLERRRPPFGLALVVLLGLLGVLAVVGRGTGGVLGLVPAAVGCAAAIIAFVLLPRLLHPRAPDVDAREASASGPSRRTFLVWAGGLAAAELGIPGLAPAVTPNDSFYRVDTAFIVPELAPENWRLRVHGMVDVPYEIGWDELVGMDFEEFDTTLICVSNPVGGPYVGNARWLGTRLRPLLERAQPHSDADMVLSSSADGWTAGTPIAALLDPDRAAILAVGMNGEPLPPEHGAPVRMVVPGLYGYVSATKWVVDLEVTRFDVRSAYWTVRGWSALGPVKLESRIDVPRQGEVLTAGPNPVAGVAWFPHSGISGVEVQVDDGAWRSAELAAAIGIDAWIQWHLEWDAPPGEHRIRVRAIGDGGEVQTAALADVVPDGATGHHTISVRVV